MGKVHRLALGRVEPSCFLKDVCRAEDSAHARMCVDSEVLVVVDSHSGFHNEPGYRFPVSYVRVYPDKSGGPDRDPTCVGCVQDTHRAFLDQVNERLLIVIFCRVVAGKSRDRDVSAPRLLADRKADDFRRRFPESGGRGGKISLGPFNPRVSDINHPPSSGS